VSDIQLHEDKHYVFKPFRVPKYRVQFQNAKSLVNIPGYVWYTPAALYLWGRFTEKNLSDLVDKYNLSVFWYQFDKPIFSGFSLAEDKSWNHLLWAVRVDEYSKLVDGILETVQFDLDNSILYQYALQRLQIYDPLAVDLDRVVTPKTPVLEISAFAVLSNKMQCAFDSKKPLKALPGMVSYLPDNLHIKAAQRLFRLSHKDADAAFSAYKRVMSEIQDEAYFLDVKNKKTNLRIKGK
jgi:hypothetical protein